MKDIKIKINGTNSYVFLEDDTLGISGENLQGKIIFEFTENTFVDGIGYLETKLSDGTTGYLMMNKVGETYQVEIKSSLLAQRGLITLQLRITQVQNGEEIPAFKSKTFFLNVLEAINAVGEMPDEYPEWIDIANAKLVEIDNLDIEANKENNITTITITRKNGTVEKAYILDGEKGEKGDKGDAGSIKFIIVNELPIENIDESAIYLVANTNPEEVNSYDEYIYTNDNWELLGNASVEVDLTDYVKDTDYAEGNKSGVVKVNYVYGLRMSTDGTVRVNPATNQEIDAKTNTYKPIVPSNLNYAVGSVKASESQSGTAKMWTSTNEDGEVGLNISTEV